uniref:HTH-type transcriptional regulator TtuA n=1 Tax=Agrobacterium albertimagni TaxID=147266 RepID=A0A7C1T5G8_9HYPH
MEKIADLGGLVEFVAAVEAGSFSAAARRLGVSVAHISRRIAASEKDLGVQLITRNTRSSTLTEQGQEFYRRSRSILDAYEEARDVARSASTIGGRIRMTMGGHYAETVLAPLVARFSAAYPEISIELEMTSRNVAMLEENFDLAVRAGPLSHSTLMARKLVSFPLLTLASPDYPGVSSGDPKDLDPKQCLSLCKRPWAFRRRSATTTVKPEGRVSTNSGTLLVQTAVACSGIIQVPSYYGESELASGALVQLFPDWTAPEEFDFFLVYPEQRHMPSRLRTLIDYLVDHVER